MAKAYSLDLRERIVTAWQRGEGSQAAVAARFGVSERCVRDLVRRQRESGSVAAKPHGGGTVGLATPAKLAALETQVAAHNDLTIAEHRERLVAAGYQQSAATVGRWLLALRLTRKKRPAKTTRPTPSGSRACARPGPGKSQALLPSTSSSWTRAGSTAP
jgi:transposase